MDVMGGVVENGGAAVVAKRIQSARPLGQGVLNPRPAYHSLPGRGTLPYPPRQADARPPPTPGSPKKSSQKSS